MEVNSPADANGQEGQHEHPHQSARISAARLALRNFTSQWFLVPQGTGAVALVLHQLDYQFTGLSIISECIWVLTIVMLCSMLLIYLFRAALNPAHVAKLLRTDIMETACLASISIAFTAIIQMTALTLVDSWGQQWGIVVFVLWWINLVMAVTSLIGIMYIFVGMEARGIDLVPVAIRLPAIAALTVAAGGGVVCRYGQLAPDLQVSVVIVSYICFGSGFVIALMCDAAFFVRMFDQSWPKRRKIYSIMIACGPYGQGSFALQILGNVVKRGAFSGTHTTKFIGSGAEHIVDVCSTLLALILWGHGVFWWAFACIAILHALTFESKALIRWDQSLGAWSLIFPWVDSPIHHCSLFPDLRLTVTGCIHKCCNPTRAGAAFTGLCCLVDHSRSNACRVMAVDYDSFYHWLNQWESAWAPKGMARELHR